MYMGALATATGGILTGVNTGFDSITTVAKGIMCLPQLLSPNGLKYLTAGIVSTLANTAGQFISGMLNFVSTTISRTIDNITGVIGSQLNAISNFIRDINESITLIKTYLRSLDERAKATLDFLLDSENCAFAAAELGKCIINDIINEIPKKTAKSLSDGTLNYNNKVLDVTTQLLAPEKSITKFMNRAQLFANKAQTQQLF